MKHLSVILFSLLVLTGFAKSHICPGDCPKPDCLNGGNATCTITYEKIHKEWSYFAPKMVYVCTCPVEYAGEVCELRNPCHPNPCTRSSGDDSISTGECQVTDDYSDYTCECDILHTGFLGKNCDVQDFCKTNPCETGVACHNVNGWYRCGGVVPRVPVAAPVPSVCPPYICGNGKCIENGPNDYTCVCPDNVSGKNCDVPMPCYYPCENGGVCTNVNMETKECACPAGYMGDNCEIGDPCDDNPCQNGGNCVSDAAKFPKTGAGCGKGCHSDYFCECGDGFMGKRCEQVDTCFHKPCENNGRCYNQDCGESRTCVCMYGYHGDSCEFEDATTGPTTIPGGFNMATTQGLTTTNKFFKLSEDLDEKEVAETKNICHGHQFDLLFIVDGSGSVGAKRFGKSLQFIKNIVSVLDIKADSTNVAMIQYGTDPKTEFLWTKDYNEVYRLIDEIVYMDAGTQTGKALMHAVDNVIPMSSRHGKVPTVVMVFTDGKSSDKRANVVEITGPKLREEADAVFAIGVGNADYEQLTAIASSPSDHYVYNSKDWKWLNSINMQIAKKMCQATTGGYGNLVTGAWTDSP